MSFKKYKEQVSIIEVAEHLGYVRNVRKGNRQDKGQVFERTFFEGGKSYKDKVVINNLTLTIDQQLYYNEEDSLGFEDRGDVIDFIRRRIHLFNVPNDPSHPFAAVNQVLSKFADQVYDLESWVNKQDFINPSNQVFNGDDWLVNPAKINELQYFINERGIAQDTLVYFLPFIRKVSNKNWKPGNYNFAFPYTILPNKDTVGYELKNYNLKLAATGTNKMEGSWHAPFAPAPGLTTNVYLFESGIDAMSFYDIYNKRGNFNNAAFFSLGGNLSRGQIENIFSYYPTAMYHSCFDNDFNGNLFDIQTACILSKKTYTFKKIKQLIFCKIGDKEITIPEANFNYQTFKELSGLRPNLKVHRAKNAKDFNDMLIASKTKS
jgi:hypothetical protein